jgi:hypothetical protein
LLSSPLHFGTPIEDFVVIPVYVSGAAVQIIVKTPATPYSAARIISRFFYTHVHSSYVDLHYYYDNEDINFHLFGKRKPPAVPVVPKSFSYE